MLQRGLSAGSPASSGRDVTGAGSGDVWVTLEGGVDSLIAVVGSLV